MNPDFTHRHRNIKYSNWDSVRKKYRLFLNLMPSPQKCWGGGGGRVSHCAASPVHKGSGESACWAVGSECRTSNLGVTSDCWGGSLSLGLTPTHCSRCESMSTARLWCVSLHWRSQLNWSDSGSRKESQGSRAAVLLEEVLFQIELMNFVPHPPTCLTGCNCIITVHNCS